MKSISSRLISNVAMFRNPNGHENQWADPNNTETRKPCNRLKVVTASVAFAAIVPLAVIEAALSSIAYTFSRLPGFSSEMNSGSEEWMKSASFAIVWSSADVLINLLANDILSEESNAKLSFGAIRATGNPLAFRMTPNAQVIDSKE